MSTIDFPSTLKAREIGPSMYQLVADLYPVCRSITGNGLRQTLQVIRSHIPLELHEIPSGTQVFDWTIPKEWNIRDAYIKDTRGHKIVDFQKCNLHVVNYSVPVQGMVPLEELKKHLFTLPAYPDWIPYRTSYYDETWGFCLTHTQFLTLQDAAYEVCIDASLEAGHLTYGEYYLPGETADEVLISCHVCHPSLGNDNLSGIALATFLAQHLGTRSRRYSYRFLFIPGTIGAIAWLCVNAQQVSRIAHGLVVTCVGDAGSFTYKKSRRGNAAIDHAVAHVLRHSGKDFRVIDFFPYGYDERQFCSPGFNLPVGCLMRAQHGCFPEYHTSADNLDFVQPHALAESLLVAKAVVDVLEYNTTYRNQNPYCEPQLGKRGLYHATGGQAEAAARQMAKLWVLNLSDGSHTLLEIAERSGLAFAVIKEAADMLAEHGLLQVCSRVAQGETQ